MVWGGDYILNKYYFISESHKDFVVNWNGP